MADKTRTEVVADALRRNQLTNEVANWLAELDARVYALEQAQRREPTNEAK